MELIERNQEKIKALLGKYEVDLAYLFGSHARSQAGPLSDIDIAVLLNPDVPPERYSDHQAHLISDLMLVFKRSKIDVAILNKAAPLLKFLVVKDGRLIYSVNEPVRIAFEVGARREYFDTQEIRRVQNEALAQRYERFAG